MSAAFQTGRFMLAGTFACTSLVLGACGGDDETTTPASSATTSTTPATGATGPDGEFPPNAHIDPATGSVDALEPDAREGTPPPPVDDDERQAEAVITGTGNEEIWRSLGRI